VLNVFLVLRSKTDKSANAVVKVQNCVPRAAGKCYYPQRIHPVPPPGRLQLYLTSLSHFLIDPSKNEFRVDGNGPLYSRNLQQTSHNHQPEGFMKHKTEPLRLDRQTQFNSVKYY
jgi:hypothetical protein